MDLSDAGSVFSEFIPLLGASARCFGMLSKFKANMNVRNVCNRMSLHLWARQKMTIHITYHSFWGYEHVYVYIIMCNASGTRTNVQQQPQLLVNYIACVNHMIKCYNIIVAHRHRSL